jgi:hypothetical protein
MRRPWSAGCRGYSDWWGRKWLLGVLILGACGDAGRTAGPENEEALATYTTPPVRVASLFSLSSPILPVRVASFFSLSSPILESE